jgi:hypothetical protein
MSIRGGSTTQAGIYYQNTVAALYMGRMLDPRISDLTQRVIAVRSEAREYVDDVVVVFADGHHRFIQVKENIEPTPGNKKWRKLWEDFEKQCWEAEFGDDDRLVIFLGKLDDWFTDLDSLCERARGASDLDEWQEILSSAKYGKVEGTVRRLLSTEHQSAAHSLRLCSVVDVEQMPLDILESLVPAWMPPNNQGEQPLFSALRDLCGKNARHKIEMDEATLRTRLKNAYGIEIFPAPVAKEENLITGSVLFEDGRPVENATVRVIGLDLDQVTTDSDGFFKFIVDDQPSWILHATYRGMPSKTNVKKGQIDQSIIIQFPYLACFSVDSPVENEEIPLGEKQERVLEGSFPILASSPKLAETASVDIEVRTYPDGVPIEQEGKYKISIYQGKWYYESAKFAGEGMYDVTAKASVGENEDFRRIRVSCIQKDKYYQRTIEEDLKIRGVSGSPVVLPENVSLEQVRLKFEHILYQKQTEFFAYYGAGDFEQAASTLASTLEIVDQILPVFLPANPNDVWLQEVRAYTLKNYALLMRSYNRDDEFVRGLAEAEKVFKAIRDQNPKDAGAWNGLGSIAALRGEYQKALVYIEMALEIAPNYEAALRDREMLLRYINK